MSTIPPTDPARTYSQDATELDVALDEALAAIRAEQDEGRINICQAASERILVLERHVEAIRALRARYFGGTTS
jgi:hypothetical protein